MTTDNQYVLKGIKKTLPICCMQGSSSKIVPTEKDFVKANKASFGNSIGSITNYATSMYNVLSNFEPGSEEYDELSYRLICMQDYQQAEIDKAKGCLARPVLKEWYDYKVNRISKDDSEETKQLKEFNQSILANKKPYFFIYNYDKLKKEFMEYYKPNNQVCRVKYKCNIHELYKKPNKTFREKEFLMNYEYGCPVNVTPCLCNKIAWMVEDHFRDVNLKYEVETFDKELLKNPNVEYSTRMYNRVKEIKDEYDKVMQLSIKSRIRKFGDEYEANSFKTNTLNNYKEKMLEVCSNEEMLCNILVDICYNSNKAKTLVWQVCGNIIIKNLLENHNNKLSYPKQVEQGDFTYKGLQFIMEEIQYEDYCE